jgi:hypothetical protein
LLHVRDKLRTLELPERNRADLISALNSVARMHLRPGEKEVEAALANLDASPLEAPPTPGHHRIMLPTNFRSGQK